MTFSMELIAVAGLVNNVILGISKAKIGESV